jgi:hypothetical protein
VAGGIGIKNLSTNKRAVLMSRLVTISGFAMIYAVLLSFFTPQLMLSPSTTAGGDTGAHIYVADYLINHLLPSGRITGWSQGWYSGFPMLVFYFPLPFLLIAALSTVIKFQIAFKIVTASGIFLLPLLTFWAFRVVGFRFPLPIIAASFTLPFVFMESYSIYGANIMSTLAGEFGYCISFGLSILFLALLNRDTMDERFRVSTGFVLGLVALSHIVTTMITILFSIYFLLNRNPKKRLPILAGVAGLGFALSAFWGLPFVDKIGYTAHMQWDQLKGLNELFPYPVRPILLLTFTGIVGAIARKDRRVYPFVWATFVSLLLFLFLPPGKLWNGRLLPYFYYFTFIWAAYGVWFLRKVVAQILYWVVFLPKRNAEHAIAFFAIAIIAAYAIGGEQQTHNWITWNYSGFENKTYWKSFDSINNYIKHLPEGRVMIEHSQDIDLFGTPRSFELLPYFANHPTIEGTLMEASISAPFHFINQAELSESPSYAILGIDYPEFNLASGIGHLRLYNIRYYLALSDKAKKEADLNPSLTFLKKFDVPDSALKFRLYEINDVTTNNYITIAKYQPLLVKTKDWRKTALNWYSRPEMFDIPLIDASHAAGLRGKYQSIDAGLKKMPELRGVAPGKISNVKVKDDEISFTTTAIGGPHWIKFSYFPNWKVRGADGPYLATPSVMMVIPKQKNVTLYYGDTTSDIAGRAISGIAWAGVIIYFFAFLIIRLFIRRRDRVSSGEMSDISADLWAGAANRLMSSDQASTGPGTNLDNAITVTPGKQISDVDPDKKQSNEREIASEELVESKDRD